MILKSKEYLLTEDELEIANDFLEDLIEAYDNWLDTNKRLDITINEYPDQESYLVDIKIQKEELETEMKEYYDNHKYLIEKLLHEHMVKTNIREKLYKIHQIVTGEL